MIRSLYGAARLPNAPAPYDTAQFRVFYPAAPEGTDAERLTGEIPPDASRRPLPIVIVLPGVNVPPDGYRWLAERLAADGIATVLVGAVEDVFAGRIGLSPGMDLGMVRPETYGSGPTASAIAPVLAALVTMNEQGTLAGALDLERVAIGGHSAGGTIALQSARPEYFPAVKAVFAYGAHTVPSAMLGFEPGTVLDVSPEVPVLVMVGDDDGVIAASRDRYEAGPEHDPVTATFEVGVTRMKGDAHLVTFAGANHLAPVDPDDPTTARGFLEPAPQTDPHETRLAMGDLVACFTQIAFGMAQPGDIEPVLEHPAIASSRTK